MTESEDRARGWLRPWIGLTGLLVFLNTTLASFQFPSAKGSTPSSSVITHGPILGRLSHDGIGVWVRTSKPSRFQVTCRIKHVCVAQSPAGETRLENDNTGWVQVKGLKPNTTYDYEVVLDSGHWMQGGSFTTLPDQESERNPQNPAGLFNFSFEFACGNQQNLLEDPGPSLPAYKTMYEKLKGRIHFQIMNGDWLYEDKRDHPVSAWQRTNQVTDPEIPGVVRIAPTIVGVWENYKLYLSRSEQLARWHRNIPTFFVYDDHEMINDINGTNNPGFRSRKAVFRDIGIQAWRDYIGWSNPLPDPNPQGIWFGRADLTEGSDILVDKQADFSNLDLDRATNLMVHWGTPTAGVMDDPPDDAGHPAAGVYKIVKILDRNRLQVYPAPKADGEQVSYSIGMRNYYRLSIGNCDFFVLDCRGLRQLHNKKNPWEKGLSMLSLEQKEWLKKGMSESAADFLFVVSSVNFTIPHVGPGPPDKDEAWTVYMEEREELIKFWDNLRKPVMVLTGDLHNSFVVKITDRVWEFGSGPHNSGNHSLMDEAMRPPSGDFEYNGRKVNIRWSTFLLDDVDYFPNKLKLPIRPIPCYCVVRVNNCFNNPKEPGGVRWVAYPQPQVIFQYFDGLTGELFYAEAIGAIKSGSEKPRLTEGAKE
jgi:phosphodiesterase/alkaline phosphatase D-like protein